MKNKDGYIHNDSSSKVEILNEQFVSAYTREDSSKIPTKGPSSLPSMEPIELQSKGVHKLLLNLKIHVHKAAGPDYIPNFILKIAADQMAPIFTKLYQFSSNAGKVPADWKKAFIVAVFKKGKKHIHVSSKFQLSPCVADNQRVKPSAYISHQKPVYPGIQERHSLPASHNTSSLDLLKMYIVLTGDVGEFVVIMRRSFTQDKVQSPKKVYSLKMEEASLVPPTYTLGDVLYNALWFILPMLLYRPILRYMIW